MMALSYAVILLSDAQKDLSCENIKSVTRAANISIDQNAIQLFSKLVSPSLVNSLTERLHNEMYKPKQVPKPVIEPPVLFESDTSESFSDLFDIFA